MFKATTIIFLFLIILSSCSIDKKISNNSKPTYLSDYSYIIYGKYTDGTGYGYATCFFIRKGKKLFLLGAAHTLTGVDTKNGTMTKGYPDTLEVALKYKDQPYKIDITQLKKNAVLKPFYEYPDFCIYKVDKKLKVNSIKSYIPDYYKIDFNQIDSLRMFGFPQENLYRSSDFLNAKPIESKLIILQNYYELNTIMFNDSLLQDSINFQIKPLSDNFGNGNSGAPVFAKYNGNEIFMGIYSGGSISKRIATIVRPGYIIRELNKR